MGMKETFQIVIDVATESSRKNLKGLRSDVSSTEGSFNKLKVGASGSLDYLKDHAGAFALGAGAALVGFGVKAVAAFEDVAKAAIDLSSATGLSIEDASRWIGVGDDFKVGAEAIATGLGKVTKTMDSGKWESYGIAVRDAGGKSRDVNDILLDTFDMLSNVTNQTDRARIGQELFGKGYQSLTPILGHTRKEYEAMLGAVESGQVITKEEAANAENMRLAQDQLADALHEVTLKAGAAAVKLAPVVTAIADIISSTGVWGDSGQALGAYEDALDAMDKKTAGASTSTRGLANGFITLREELANNISGLDATKKGFDRLFNPSFNLTLDATNTAFNELLNKDPSKAQATLNSFVDLMKSGDKEAQDYLKGLGITQGTLDKWQVRLDEVNGAQGDLNNTTEDSKKVLEDAKKAQEEATKAIEEHRQALLDDAQALEDQITAHHNFADAGFALKDAQDNFAESLAGVSEAVKEAEGDTRKIDKVYRDVASSAKDVANEQVALAQSFLEGSGETLTATEQVDLFNSSLIESAATAKGKARQAILDYAASFNEIPAEKMTEIKAAIDAGEFKKAEMLLAAASAPREAAIIATADTRQANSDLDKAARDRSVTFLGTLSPGVKRPGVSAPEPDHTSSYDINKLPHHAAGTSNAAPGLALVGEQGPELVMLGGGEHILTAAQTKNVSSGSGSDPNNDLQMWAAQLEMGDITAAKYKELLTGRLGTLEKYSSEYMSVWREIRSIDKDTENANAEHDKKIRDQQDAMYANGEISDDFYKEILKGRLKTFEKYSTDYMSTLGDIRSIERESDRKSKENAEFAQRFKEAAVKQHLDRVEDLYQKAADQLAADEARRAADKAVADYGSAMDEAWRVGSDKKATAEDKQSAIDAATEAGTQAAKALLDRADADAVLAGFAHGTPEWARSVRSALLQDEKNAPGLAPAIDRLLVGIPKLAKGGVVTSPTVAMIGEAGAEAVIPLSKMGSMGGTYNITVNTGADPNSVVAAIKRYTKNGGVL